MLMIVYISFVFSGDRCVFFFSSRRGHTGCALVTGGQTCALPILTPFVPSLWKHRSSSCGAERKNGPSTSSGRTVVLGGSAMRTVLPPIRRREIGRAACRERVCQYV